MTEILAVFYYLGSFYPSGKLGKRRSIQFPEVEQPKAASIILWFDIALS